ncbi:MAG: hypothetical protein U0821_07260 [Chloroflexota bacterium]
MATVYAPWRDSPRPWLHLPVSWPWGFQGQVLAGPGWFWLAVALVAYSALSIGLAVGIGYHDPDSLSRTAHADFSVFGRDPHLAAIGFVWTPLATLAQIPLLLLLRPLGYPQLAGEITSVAATVATLWVFDAYARHRGVFAWLRRPLILLYAVHPLIVLQAIDGLAEAPFILTISLMAICTALWVKNRRPVLLGGTGLLCAAAFLIRYESLPAALAIGAIVAAVHVRRAWRTLWPMVADMLVFGAPLAYTIALWIFLSWQILGEPLYFAAGPYSNRTMTEYIRSTVYESHPLYGLLHPLYLNVMGSLEYALDRTAMLSLAFFVAIPLVAGLAAASRSAASLAMLGLWLAFPLFAAAQLFQGQSEGWLRYYLYGVPGSVFLAIEAFAVAKRDRLLDSLLGLLLLLSMAISAVVALGAVTDPKIGRMEYAILAHVAGKPYDEGAFTTFPAERELARWVDDLPEGSTVLVDAVTGFPISLFTRHPERLIVTPNRDFEAILATPLGRADHLLIRTPGSVVSMADRARLLIVHPELIEGSTPWALLERQVGNWQVFKVVGNPPPPDPDVRRG